MRSPDCPDSLGRLVSKIHLVDRSLMLLMAVLLAQSAYSLLASPGSPVLAGDIDIIVRTSSAAIFGYFLSANFVRRPPSVEEPLSSSAHSMSPVEDEPPADPPPEAILADVSLLPPSAGEEHPSSPELPAANCLQVAVATGIGLFCLVTLLLLRNTALGDAALAAQPEGTTATVAQLRDFVSGCVGFLIGCPTHPSTSPQS